jgi:hypothetical protein
MPEHIPDRKFSETADLIERLKKLRQRLRSQDRHSEAEKVNDAIKEASNEGGVAR